MPIGSGKVPEGGKGGMPSAVVAEVHDHIKRIKILAKEIEDVPNLLPDMWSMREVDKKCQEIRQNADLILKKMNKHIGSGVG